jgi:microcystin-dependent protein
MTTIGTSYNVAPNTSADNVGIPIGTMLMWATATAPTNYLICNGAAVSRRTYATLFGILGTTWGVGDGSTTFNLPNTAGRVVRGVNGTYTLAGTGGADSVVISADNLPQHRHGYNLAAGTGYSAANGSEGNRATQTQNYTNAGQTYLDGSNTLTTNSAVAIANTWVGVNYIIKFA